MIGNSFRKALRFIAFSAGLIALGGCPGGGGGPGAPITPPPMGGGGNPGGSVPDWTMGVFEPASTFKDRCEAPRTGVDIEGNPFPDRTGSTTLENFWLRSWTEETYLWNDEVTDRDPRTFDDRLEYFDLLRTFEVTPSGEDKDDFHFAQTTEEFLQSRTSAPTASYGVSFAALSTTPPRDFRVRYTDANTPASTLDENGLPPFLRGARIVEIDGADFINGDDVDTLNDGLFPATAGESHDFLMRDPDGTERLVTLISADLARDPVNRVEVIETPSGPVGYVLFNTFSPFASEADIVEAFEELSAEGVTDLVLDLRYNGGGLLAVASQLSYMIAGPAFTTGRTFEQLRFNDDAGAFNPVTGEPNDPIPFFSETLGFSLSAGAPLPDLRDVNRVFILSTESTCSASEAVINGLRGVDFEVILIGDTTCGKPFGFFPQDNCGITYFTIQFQGTNDQGFGDFADGFIPMDSPDPFGVRIDGCQVVDDLTGTLGDPGEKLLSAALSFRETGSCPAGLAAEASLPRSGPQSSADDPMAITLPLDVPGTNLDMRTPGDAP
ncbi:MAG: S41 family peptidase [Pseudomonadota bacterium]